MSAPRTSAAITVSRSHRTGSAAIRADFLVAGRRPRHDANPMPVSRQPPGRSTDRDRDGRFPQRRFGSINAGLVVGRAVLATKPGLNAAERINCWCCRCAHVGRGFCSQLFETSGWSECHVRHVRHNLAPRGRNPIPRRSFSAWWTCQRCGAPTHGNLTVGG